MQPEIYAWLEGLAPWMVLWSFVFTILHTLRIVWRLRTGAGKAKDNAPLTEIAGLPVNLLQSVAFVMAAVRGDILSMLLFLWWGPGFVVTIAVVGWARLRRVRIDWRPYSTVISWLCKLYYLAYVVAFYVYDMPGLMFAFSVWILNDQYEKAFMSLDADRTRRTFHDRWLFRVLYPAGLLVPLFVDLPWRWFCAAYGLALLGLWAAGLRYVWRQEQFFVRPEDPSLLRNMVYSPELRSP